MAKLSLFQREQGRQAVRYLLSTVRNWQSILNVRPFLVARRKNVDYSLTQSRPATENSNSNMPMLRAAFQYLLLAFVLMAICASRLVDESATAAYCNNDEGELALTPRYRRLTPSRSLKSSRGWLLGVSKHNTLQLGCVESLFTIIEGCPW